MDDTVLILAEPYLREKAPAVAQTLGEVFAAVLNSFMEQGISCQAGVFDQSTGHFYIEKIRTREDYENILYLFLRHTGGGGKALYHHRISSHFGTAKICKLYLYYGRTRGRRS